MNQEDAAMTEQERHIITLARQVRTAQKAYYANPNRDTLNASRRLERELDRLLADYDAGRISAVQPAFSLDSGSEPPA